MIGATQSVLAGDAASAANDTAFVTLAYAKADPVELMIESISRAGGIAAFVVAVGLIGYFVA